MTIDLEAVRQHLMEHDCFVSGCCVIQDKFDVDIKALIAEVELLRAVETCVDCYMVQYLAGSGRRCGKHIAGL